MNLQGRKSTLSCAYYIKGKLVKNPGSFPSKESHGNKNFIKIIINGKEVK